VEPDRFDDVSYRIVQHPDAEPPRPPGRRRKALVAAGLAAVSAGALAAGASALGGGETRAPAPARAPGAQEGWTSYAPLNARDGHRGLCHRGEGHTRSDPRSTATGPRT
jgi:hypothetical protein